MYLYIYINKILIATSIKKIEKKYTERTIRRKVKGGKKNE
jgi:hypothetical protein